jgi:hypothetical protein
MGILCLVMSLLLGFVGVMEIIAGGALPAQLLGGELLICACVLFAGAAVCSATAELQPEKKPKES